MSYILDALKRAEAERNGAAAASGALPASFVAIAPARPALRALRWLVPVMAAIAIGTFLFNRPSDAPPVPAVEIVSSAPAQPAPPAPAPKAAAAPPALIIPPAAARAPGPAPAPARPSASTPPANPKVNAKAKAIGTLRDLPESIQREIPPLAVGGYLYSATAADRTVLINKRLRREGDEIAPGLVLERLGPNEMVMSYRGYRFRNSY